jgi:hypothetical protein
MSEASYFPDEPDEDGTTDIPDEDAGKSVTESQRWFLYTPELFVRAGYGTLELDFIAAVNPTDHQIRADIGLGVEPAEQARLYRALVSPEKRMSAEAMRDRLAKRLPLAPWLAYARIVWEPRKTVLVPKVWQRALRHDVAGRVQSGHVPFILFGDETEETAPDLDECLQFQPPAPPRARSKSRVASRVSRPRSKT